MKSFQLFRDKKAKDWKDSLQDGEKFFQKNKKEVLLFLIGMASFPILFFLTVSLKAATTGLVTTSEEASGATPTCWMKASPSSLTIPAGTTITWGTNNSNSSTVAQVACDGPVKIAKGNFWPNMAESSYPSGYPGYFPTGTTAGTETCKIYLNYSSTPSCQVEIKLNSASSTTESSSKATATPTPTSTKTTATPTPTTSASTTQTQPSGGYYCPSNCYLNYDKKTCYYSSNDQVCAAASTNPNVAKCKSGYEYCATTKQCLTGSQAYELCPQSGSSTSGSGDAATNTGPTKGADDDGTSTGPSNATGSDREGAEGFGLTST